ncbi:hypothetical protein AeNC1_008406 [Aphanomyces euteiches]|nr:hypothetical protein AeNC1_008406 [Aphanomyces euteiches]
MSDQHMDDVLVAAAYAGVEPIVDTIPIPHHPASTQAPFGAVLATSSAAEEEGEVKDEVTVGQVDVTKEIVDQNMEGEESSSDEESEPDSDDEDQKKLRIEIEGALKKEEQAAAGPLVTAHEVKQLPIKKPNVELTPECPIAKMGRILNVNRAENAITIQSVPNQLPLDEGSVLCLTNRQVLGCVDEVFGPVSLPLYLIRFETAEDIPEAATLHADVFYATEHATYVQPEKCRVKGSDASNLYDEEPGDDEMEFSDDEAEQSAKRSKRKHPGNKQQSTEPRPPRQQYREPHHHQPRHFQAGYHHDHPPPPRPHQPYQAPPPYPPQYHQPYPMAPPPPPPHNAYYPDQYQYHPGQYQQHPEQQHHHHPGGPGGYPPPYPPPQEQYPPQQWQQPPPRPYNPNAPYPPYQPPQPPRSNYPY